MEPITPQIEDIIAQHKAIIIGLHGRHKAGDIDGDAYLAQSAPHAYVIAALQREMERDRVVSVVKAAIERPKAVEAAALSLLEFCRSAEDGQFGFSAVLNNLLLPKAKPDAGGDHGNG